MPKSSTKSKSNSLGVIEESVQSDNYSSSHHKTSKSSSNAISSHYTTPEASSEKSDPRRKTQNVMGLYPTEKVKQVGLVGNLG